MHVETSVALNFVISYLYNKLPRRRVDMFAEELEKGLKKKFEGHWYPDKPFKGSAYRCIRVNGEKVDPVIVLAAFNAGLDIEEVKGYLPAELTLWIDPSEVSYRIGEKGLIKILYSDKKEEEPETIVDREVQAASKGFNPEAQCFKPIDSLSSSLSNLSLSPSSPNSSGGWSTSTSPSTALFNSASPAPTPTPTATPTPAAAPNFLQKEGCKPKFTAATFAQTKFGSTKLKTHMKRPTRLSPTEFGNYFRQRSTTPSFTNPPPQRPRSLSPRDPRVEFLLDQQQRLILTSGQQSPHQPPFGAQQAPFLADLYRHPSPSHLSPGALSPAAGFPDLLSNASLNSISPEGHKSFLDGLGVSSLNYPGQLQHLLVAN